MSAEKGERELADLSSCSEGGITFVLHAGTAFSLMLCCSQAMFYTAIMDPPKDLVEHDAYTMHPIGWHQEQHKAMQAQPQQHLRA